MKSKDLMILVVVVLVAATILIPGMMDKVKSVAGEIMQPTVQPGYAAPTVNRDTNPGKLLIGGIIVLLILAVLSAPLKGKG